MAFSFQGTTLKILNQDVLIVVVKKYVVDNPFERDKMISVFSEKFPMHNVVLMAQSFNHKPLFFGNLNIVNALARIPFEQFTWHNYNVN